MANNPAASPREQLFDFLEFVRFTNLFRSIDRAIWFKGVRENERDGEHAFQLALCAWYLNQRLGLNLDVTRLIMYALVHDLVETYAKDTPAFANIMARIIYVESERITRADKDKREREALERIEREWGERFPEMVEHMHKYWDQADDESQFIYALDKLVAGLNIYEDKGRTYFKLDLTLKEVDAYQRPKVAKCPAVLALYEVLYAELAANEPSFFNNIIRKNENGDQ